MTDRKCIDYKNTDAHRAFTVAYTTLIMHDDDNVAERTGARSDNNLHDALTDAKPHQSYMCAQSRVYVIAYREHQRNKGSLQTEPLTHLPVAPFTVRGAAGAQRKQRHQ